MVINGMIRATNILVYQTNENLNSTNDDEQERFNYSIYDLFIRVLLLAVILPSRIN